MSIEYSDPSLVSIIMGVFNCEKTVGDCIESVLNQTYPNWEFIICDDCSTDGTLKILQRYASKDGRIRIIQNKYNRKLAYSLNHCLEFARGKYVARMDADDLCMPDRLAKQIEFLETHTEYDVVGSNSYVFDITGIKGVRKVKEYPSKDILLMNTPFMHPTIIMKKRIYDKLGGYTVSKKTQRSQDLELWFRFYQAGYKGYNIQEPLYQYREIENDHKKHTIKIRLNTMRLFLEGYSKLGFPIWKYVYALKPIVSVLIPQRMMKKLHDAQISRSNTID